MEPHTVKDFYRKQSVVQHYSQATHRVGLWESEKILIQRYWSKDQTILELGCGGGRIAIGLWELGYRNLTAIDYSKEMVHTSKTNAEILRYPIDFRHGDATQLRFADQAFSGALFGFNGLMQIPQRANRLKAMSEIARVLQPDAYFIFTSHNRANPKNRKYWQAEQKRWNQGKQQEELDEFGDIYRETEFGPMYIHSPELQELKQDLRQAGFITELEMPRSKIAKEPPEVRAFSDNCRFWVTRKKE